MKHSLTKIGLLFVATLAVASLVWFALPQMKGESLEKVNLFLLWEPQAQFLGYYVAEERGFFRDFNLDVNIRHDLGMGESFNQILSGRNNYAINQFTNVIDWLSRAPEVSALSIINKGCNIAWIGGNSRDQLQTRLASGRLYSWWGPKDLLLRTYLLSLEKPIADLERRVKTEFPEKLDPDMAILVMAYNEIMDYENFAQSPYASYCDLGLPIFEDTLVGQVPTIPRDSKIHERMVTAVWKGWDWTKNHPESALTILMKRHPRNPIERQRRQLSKFLEHLPTEKESGSNFVSVVETIHRMMALKVIRKNDPLQKLLETIQKSSTIRRIGIFEEK